MDNLHFIDASRIARGASAIRASLERLRHSEIGQASLTPGAEQHGAARDRMLAEMLILRAQLDHHCGQLERAIDQMHGLPAAANQDLSSGSKLPEVLLAARAALADSLAIAEFLRPGGGSLSSESGN